MKHNWEYKQLGEIGVILTGSTPSTSVKEYYDQSDYMFVKPGDIEESGITYLKASETYISELAFNTASRKLPKHSVLVTCIGTIGKVGILQQEATCNQQINAIIPAADNIYYKYLAYAISSIKSFLISKKNGPVVPIINKTQFSKFKIPVPPMVVQEHIVAELDKINETIEDCRELLCNLDALAQSLFYDTFGDPIKNPKKWPIKQLKALSSLITNGTTPKGGQAVYVDSGITFFRSQNVWRNRLVMDDVAYLDEATNATMRGSMLHHNDILITKTGRINTENSSLGRSALFTGEDNTANINGHVYLVRLERTINPRFVLAILLTDSYRDLIRRVCVGAIDKRQLNLSHIEQFPIILPPLSLQEQFAARIEQIEVQKKAVEQTIAELQTLLDSRMDYWFN